MEQEKTIGALEAAFEAWWVSEGQFCRAGGGDYEKTFAFRAYEAATERAAKLCDRLGGEVDMRNPDDVKMAANSLAVFIRAKNT